MNYTEVKNMFLQSFSAEKEIQAFRHERIQYFKELSEGDNDSIYSKYLLLHVIPDSFADRTKDENMYLISRRKGIDFRLMFGSFNCANLAKPCVDGLRFSAYNGKEECTLYNNGIIEAFQPLERLVKDWYPSNGTVISLFTSTDAWDIIEGTVKDYIHTMAAIIPTRRIYVCISIVGGKGLATYTGGFHDESIDRNNLLLAPTVIDDITDANLIEQTLKKHQIEFRLALGIKGGQTQSLITEVYGC